MAQRWSEAVALRVKISVIDNPLSKRFEVMRARVESEFQRWMEKHFAALSTLPPIPRPVMLHHIPRYLAHSHEGKRAIVVVDGLALDQWVTIREELPDDWALDEGGIFAWVPTLTSVSRQSIFAGDPPFYFAPTIGDTYKEPKHWSKSGKIGDWESPR